jgi:2,3-bisphosphoglycerate-independent phosphoglycerate mutase
MHSVTRHLSSILPFTKNADLKDVFIHFIADGRDTAKDSEIEHLEEIEKTVHEIRVCKIATRIGRVWAMDRDNRQAV